MGPPSGILNVNIPGMVGPDGRPLPPLGFVLPQTPGHFPGNSQITGNMHGMTGMNNTAQVVQYTPPLLLSRVLQDNYQEWVVKSPRALKCLRRVCLWPPWISFAYCKHLP